MDWLERVLRRVAAELSSMLNPAVYLLDRLHVAVRQQMDAVGVPYAWQGPLLDAGWALVLFMLVRSLTGWLRLVVVVAVAAVLFKLYGMLPGG